MGSEFTVGARTEITAKYAGAYAKSSKKDKGRLLDALERHTELVFDEGRYSPDMHTGWVFTRSIRNNAHVHILSALDQAITAIPFEVTGLDFDNGTEFINHDVIGWAAGRKIFFTS